MADTRTRILNLAEQMMRVGGYHGFSFRDIAAEIGIKSSSVHHHFPTKEALTEAVMQRYMAEFFEVLGEPTPEGATVQDQIQRYTAAYNASFAASRSGCLCGVLSNEHALLPDSVIRVVDAFADKNIAWLKQVLELEGDLANEGVAAVIYSSMQGALSLSSMKSDVRWIEDISEAMLGLVTK